MRSVASPRNEKNPNTSVKVVMITLDAMAGSTRKVLSAIGTNAGRLNTLTAKIIAVEEQADGICDQGLKALFLASRQNNPQGNAQDNAMSFIIGSELYDHLEKVVDRFEDVSNEINSVVVDQL